MRQQKLALAASERTVPGASRSVHALACRRYGEGGFAEMQHNNQESCAVVTAPFTLTGDKRSSRSIRCPIGMKGARRIAVSLFLIALVTLTCESVAAARARDVRAPSTPTKVRVASASTTSVGIAWSASR